MDFSTYYWTGRTNIGDYYGYWLLNKLFGTKRGELYMNFINSGYNVDVVTTGSIITLPAISKNTFIVGSGKHNNFPNEKFCGNLDNVLAVRGTLTRDWLRLPENTTLGDPGLLAPLFYTRNKNVEKKYKFGFIPHWMDKDYFNKTYGGQIHIINTDTTDVDAFLNDILSCEFIFSSSLHGIIFAHAFGIPAIHIKHLCRESKDDFKFKDYYSILDVDYCNIPYTEGFAFEHWLKDKNTKRFCPSRSCIGYIQHNLLKAFSTLEWKLTQLWETKRNNIRTCLCGIAKLENNYIREWVEHYKRLGFTKIFLYDNNDVKGEQLSDPIKDYVESNYVQIIDVRGKKNQQIACYDEFYHSYANDFDWVAFFDIDEFLNLPGYKTIQNFVSSAKFIPYGGIAVNWKYYDDNNLVTVKDNDYSVVKRFTHEYEEEDSPSAQHRQTKRILRTNLPSVTINSSHGSLVKAKMKEYENKVPNNIKICNVLGDEVINDVFIENWTHNGAYLSHYRYKTLEEFVTNKMKKGYPTLFRNSGADLNIDDFFKLNEVTDDKLRYLRGLDLGSALLRQTQQIEKTSNTNKIINMVPQVNKQKPKKNEIKEKPTFSTYYWKDRKNVGDYYGYWLLNKLFGDKYNFVWGDSNVDIISTGSILTSPVVGPSTFVAGCGKHGFKDNEQFHGILENVIGVRGQLSEKFLGGTDLLLGDPGTYISALYNKSVEVTHTYGLICHWKDIKFFKEKYGDKLFIIDTSTTDICKFIDQIRSCSFIFSSSLHGLIFAHSYGIPAVHIKHLCIESKDDFKFKDYYSTLGINYMNIQYSDSFNFSNYYNSVSDITNYCPTKKRIQKIQNDLKLCYDLLDDKLFARAITRQNKVNAKICLCGIAKCENSYIREWVEYHKNLGFDKIYLYDNNDIDGEHFEDVIADYIQSGYMSLLDVRGLTNQQIIRYDEFYHSYANDYDWVAFFDIDEFLNIGNASDIHEFIAQQKYDAFDAIAVNWKYFDDNDLIHYSSIPVTQRFIREHKEKNFAHSQYKFSKRIIRTGLDLVINSSHGPLTAASNLEYSSDKTNNILVCNVAGEKIKNTHFFNNWSHDGGYLAHYRFKSIEEYIINKMKRGYPTLYKNSGKDLCIDDFFELNIPTKEKLDCAAKLLGLSAKQLYKKYKIKTDEDTTTYLYF